MFLNNDAFAAIIQSTPLVSIDLVVVNKHNQVLLGQRLNRPAKSYWFVPGGRIQKNESLAKAFLRLTREELGVGIDINEAKLLGPFDHFYEDNVFGEGFSTHYVAIGYKIFIDEDLNDLPKDIQHSSYKWFDITHIEDNSEIHRHTKLYFK